MATSVKRAIIAKNDKKLNALYFYTTATTMMEKINCHESNYKLEVDLHQLQKYIYWESNSKRINAFETLLSTTDTVSLSWCEKIIQCYNNNNNNNNNNNDINEIENIKNIILRDFHTLSTRYRNYSYFLLGDFQWFTRRKFLLNMVLYMKPNGKYYNGSLREILAALIKLWSLIDVEREILQSQFVPAAFAQWYQNYPFYQYFFSPILQEDIKSIFYGKFFESIIESETIRNVDREIETMFRRHTRTGLFSYT